MKERTCLLFCSRLNWLIVFFFNKTFLETKKPRIFLLQSVAEFWGIQIVSTRFAKLYQKINSYCFKIRKNFFWKEMFKNGQFQIVIWNRQYLFRRLWYVKSMTTRLHWLFYLFIFFQARDSKIQDGRRGGEFSLIERNSRICGKMRQKCPASLPLWKVGENWNQPRKSVNFTAKNKLHQNKVENTVCELLKNCNFVGKKPSDFLTF